MNLKSLVSTVITFVAATGLALSACGGDDGDDSGDGTESDDGGTGTGTADDGGDGTSGDDGTGGDGSDGSATDDTGGSGGSGTDGTQTGGTDTSGGAGDCTAWLVTYDLTGSTFEITDTQMGMGDQVNVLEEPYDDFDNFGPGTMVLRFQDDGGAPAEGVASIVSYDVVMNFSVTSAGTTVTTDLHNTAEADCVSDGVLTGDTIAWDPAVMRDHHSVGELSCEGSFCGTMGAPPEGEPTPVDDTSDHPINDFVFTDGVGAFTMEEVIVQSDNVSTTLLALVGTETDRELEETTPSCGCN